MMDFAADPEDDDIECCHHGVPFDEECGWCLDEDEDENED